jgi:hypothetical protein
MANELDPQTGTAMAGGKPSTGKGGGTKKAGGKKYRTAARGGQGQAGTNTGTGT